VDVASSVDEARAAMKKIRYDAIVSDYQMPGEDGIFFLKQLRMRSAPTPVILFTGDSSSTPPDMAKEAGVREFIRKPFAIDILAETVRKALNDKA